MSFFDTPDYLELPESLIIACNEDDKDNVSSESGGGASSGGSLGSIPNTCGITSTSATSLETSNDSISSEHGSDKTVLKKPKEENVVQGNQPLSTITRDTTIESNIRYSHTSIDGTFQAVSLNSGKLDTLELQRNKTNNSSISPTKSRGPRDDPVSFGWKTKAVIYGSVFSCIGYFIYTYWHIILMSLVALFFYEMWDLYSARKRKNSIKRSD